MPDTRRTRLHRSAPERGYSKSARLAFDRAMANATDLETEGIEPYWIKETIPEAWDTLERDIDVFEKKVQISLRLDESVAKFYRAQGQGYQARINRILATFAQMRIAQVNIAAHRIRLQDAERAREREERGRSGEAG